MDWYRLPLGQTQDFSGGIIVLKICIYYSISNVELLFTHTHYTLVDIFFLSIASAIIEMVVNFVKKNVWQLLYVRKKYKNVYPFNLPFHESDLTNWIRFIKYLVCTTWDWLCLGFHTSDLDVWLLDILKGYTNIITDLSASGNQFSRLGL